MSIFMYFISQLELFVVLFLLSWNEHLFALYFYTGFFLFVIIEILKRSTKQLVGFQVFLFGQLCFFSIHIPLQLENYRQLVLLSLSHFRTIIWYCILEDRSNMSPIQPCISSLSHFRPIVWYCILNDRSNMSPIRPCISSLSHFRPTVW